MSMKIDDQSIKALYQDYVRCQKPVSRENCPPVDLLVKTLRSGSSRKKAARIVDHISRCHDCAEEWKFLVEIVRNEKEFIREVEQWGGERQKTGELRPLFSRFSWGLASLLAGFIIVGILVLKFLVPPAQDKYRASSFPGIELLQPARASVSVSSLVFRWKPVQNREYYTLEIFDEALVPLWKSEPILESFASPPEELRLKLAAGKSYFWMVTAVLPGGERFHSSLREFVAGK
ncbi:MAG: hypothetical protein AB1715_02955 [Acidobacteriota bacterium]